MRAIGPGEELEEFPWVISFPLPALSFCEAALIALFASLPLLFFSKAASFRFSEDFGRGVVTISGLRDGGADSFFEELDDLDVSLVGVIVSRDFEAVSYFERGARFEVFSCAFDLTYGAIVRGLAAGFVESDGPEPFIHAHLFEFSLSF